MFNKKFLFVILSIILMIAMLAGCGDKTVEPEYVIPEELSVSYGSTLGDIPLPTGFSWQDDLSTSVGDVGQNTFLVTYTPEDLGVYKVVNDIQVTITVTKANPAYTAPQNLTAVYGQTLADVNLPTGFSWVDSTLSVGNVGKNSFNATYTPANVEKYNIIGNVTLQVEVGKAPGVIDDSAVVKTFIYNGNNQSISGATGTGEITYENNSFKNAGRYNVSINAAENDNYFAATKEIEVIVNKATYGEITFIGSSYSYDGTKKSIAIATELNNEISVKYYIGEVETNEAINAGTYEVTA
nr:hypothetical protein [Clostridia bacterium]